MIQLRIGSAKPIYSSPSSSHESSAAESVRRATAPNSHPSPDIRQHSTVDRLPLYRATFSLTTIPGSALEAIIYIPQGPFHLSVRVQHKNELQSAQYSPQSNRLPTCSWAVLRSPGFREGFRHDGNPKMLQDAGPTPATATPWLYAMPESCKTVLAEMPCFSRSKRLTSWWTFKRLIASTADILPHQSAASGVATECSSRITHDMNILAAAR